MDGGDMGLPAVERVATLPAPELGGGNEANGTGNGAVLLAATTAGGGVGAPAARGVLLHADEGSHSGSSRLSTPSAAARRILLRFGGRPPSIVAVRPDVGRCGEALLPDTTRPSASMRPPVDEVRRMMSVVAAVPSGIGELRGLSAGEAPSVSDEEDGGEDDGATREKRGDEMGEGTRANRGEDCGEIKGLKRDGGGDGGDAMAVLAVLAASEASSRGERRRVAAVGGEVRCGLMANGAETAAPVAATGFGRTMVLGAGRGATDGNDGAECTSSACPEEAAASAVLRGTEGSGRVSRTVGSLALAVVGEAGAEAVAGAVAAAA